MQYDPGRAAAANDNSPFAVSFLAALQQQDLSAMRELALRAGADRKIDAVRPLCNFLQPASRKWCCPRTEYPGWLESQASAVRALEEIGSPISLPVLVRTLASTPSPAVREAATSAVRRFGAMATEQLAETVKSSTDWRLEGMEAVLKALAQPDELESRQKQAAGSVLLNVLADHYPRPSARWSGSAGLIGAVTAAGVMVLSVAAMLMSGSASSDIALVLFISCSIPAALAGFFMWLASKAVLSSSRSALERNHLYPVAAASLARLNDMRTLAGLMRLAFVTPDRTSAWHARGVLMSLLPRISHRDTGQFPQTLIDELNTAVNRSYEPNFIVAVLYALEFVGNASSIYPVLKLIRRASTRQIYDTACRVAQVLEARAERMKAGESLLRGAQAPDAKPKELLRPSYLEPEKRPEELLRPTANDTINP